LATSSPIINFIMPAIAIIDDNRDQRETLKKRLSFHLREHESSLLVIDQFPFAKYEEYFPWIDGNDVRVLILDEKLNDQTDNGQGPVDYKGNELVSQIRSKLKDIPIFTITAHAEDQDLQAKFGEFDHIINREDFNEHGSKYVEIMIRSTQRYLDENEEELREFDALTKLVASGTATQENKTRLAALQVKLNLPLSGDLMNREQWLKEYEKHIQDLEVLKIAIENKLKK
jgi:CheY-like chemotaxis protein